MLNERNMDISNWKISEKKYEKGKTCITTTVGFKDKS